MGYANTKEITASDAKPELTRKLLQAAEDAYQEAFDAASKWAPFNSAHEAFAVAHEEFDELWDHVKVNQKRRDLSKMRMEAVQAAAMLLRFITDICDSDRGRV